MFWYTPTACDPAVKNELVGRAMPRSTSLGSTGIGLFVHRAAFGKASAKRGFGVVLGGSWRFRGWLRPRVRVRAT